MNVTAAVVGIGINLVFVGIGYGLCDWRNGKQVDEAQLEVQKCAEVIAMKNETITAMTYRVVELTEERDTALRDQIPDALEEVFAALSAE